MGEQEGNAGAGVHRRRIHRPADRQILSRRAGTGAQHLPQSWHWKLDPRRSGTVQEEGRADTAPADRQQRELERGRDVQPHALLHPRRHRAAGARDAPKAAAEAARGTRQDQGGPSSQGDPRGAHAVPSDREQPRRSGVGGQRQCRQPVRVLQPALRRAAPKRQDGRRGRHPHVGRPDGEKLPAAAHEPAQGADQVQLQLRLVPELQSRVCEAH
mmetsp:Transcript_40050/g.67165  ORF Transcript_40050/g.67165 Transcript_40050/m.67165 type:complete len:214 (-) Transcript_40050:957-1598(-)